MIQSDGDIVDAVSGSTIISFPEASGDDYYLSLRHRNHLGVITVAPLPAATNPTMINFSLPTTILQGENARLEVTTNDGNSNIALLWSGDINHDHRMVAIGENNDLSTMLSDVLVSSGNTAYNNGYSLRGYHDGDLNMDGVTLFTGPDNDAQHLLANILLHPANDEFISNFVAVGGWLIP